MRPLVIAMFFLFALRMATSANPISMDPGGPASRPAFAYVYGMVAFVCIAIEVSLLKIIGHAFHQCECDRSTMTSLVLLNVLTLIGVLFPIHRVSGSILLSEIAVVLVEACFIHKIFTKEGGFPTIKQAIWGFSSPRGEPTKPMAE